MVIIGFYKKKKKNLNACKVTGTDQMMCLHVLQQVSQNLFLYGATIFFMSLCSY